MTTLVILAVLAALAVLAVVALRRLFRRPLPRPADRAEAKPADARAGDVVSIAGAGEDFADLDFTVLHRNRYEVGPRRWIELSGEYRGAPVALHVWESDEPVTALVRDGRKPDLVEAGLSEESLAGDMRYDGKLWRRRLEKEFVLFRDSEAQGSGFHGWVFEEEGGGRLLMVKKSAEGLSAWVGSKLDPAVVNVFRAR